MMKVNALSAVAALALILPLATSTGSFAQQPRGAAGGGARAAVGMGGGMPMGGGRGFASHGAGGTFAAGRVAAAPGGAAGFSGGQWGHHRHGGFWPGVAVGAALGSYAYYGGPYSGPDYYDDYSYDTGPMVAVVPEGGDSIADCQQRYRSYDPASGTYLGYDGLRHPCP